MPRAKNDPYKRKCAQALNHLTAAILDLNAVYEAFDAQREKQLEIATETSDPLAQANTVRYTKMTENIKSAMMGSAVIRQAIVEFAGEAWDLDEESIRVYLG
jgi:hypothetical protein